MEGACWTRKPSKCWGYRDEHCFCRLRNFTFELFDAPPTSENIVPKLALNLSQPSEVTFSRDGQFTVRSSDSVTPVLHCEKSDLRGWINMLNVFNGRDKPWSPIPLPAVCHIAMMACIKFVHQRGMKEEGIFRLPGSHQGIETLYLNLITERVTSLDGLDMHVVCGCLKKLMRALPETILTNRVYAVVTDKKTSPEEVAQAIKGLPAANSEVLTALFKLMKEICASPATKMNKEALGVCMTPCWSRKDTSLVEHMTLSFDPLFQYFQMGSELDSIRQAAERTLPPIDGARFGTLPLPPKKTKSSNPLVDTTSSLLPPLSITSSCSPSNSSSTEIPMSNFVSDCGSSSSISVDPTLPVVDVASTSPTPTRRISSPPPPPSVQPQFDIPADDRHVVESPTALAVSYSSADAIASSPIFCTPITSSPSSRPAGRSSSAPPPPTLSPSPAAKVTVTVGGPPPPPLRSTSLSESRPGIIGVTRAVSAGTEKIVPSPPPPPALRSASPTLMSRSISPVFRSFSPPPPPTASLPETEATTERSSSPIRLGSPMADGKSEISCSPGSPSSKFESPTRPGSPGAERSSSPARAISSSASGLRQRGASSPSR